MEGPSQGVIMAMAKSEDIKQVRSDIQTVYSTEDAATALALLRKYHTSYLWVPKAQLLKFSSNNLKAVVTNKDHILYQVLSSE